MYYLQTKGAPRRITAATSFDGLSIVDDGTLVARNQGAVYPPRVVVVSNKGNKVRRLDRINDEVMADVDTGSRASVTYTGADGAEIQMWVHYPPGFGQEFTDSINPDWLTKPYADVIAATK